METKTVIEFSHKPYTLNQVVKAKRLYCSLRSISEVAQEMSKTKGSMNHLFRKMKDSGYISKDEIEKNEAAQKEKKAQCLMKGRKSHSITITATHAMIRDLVCSGTPVSDIRKKCGYKHDRDVRRVISGLISREIVTEKQYRKCKRAKIARMAKNKVKVQRAKVLSVNVVAKKPEKARPLYKKKKPERVIVSKSAVNGKNYSMVLSPDEYLCCRGCAFQATSGTCICKIKELTANQCRDDQGRNVIWVIQK